MTLKGVDISGYQSGIPAHQDFVIIKATEGTSYVDGPFHTWWVELGTSKTLRGVYHFSHPANSATAEADHFLSVVQPVVKKGDLLVLDHEVNDGQGPAHCAQWARDWCARVKQKTGITPVVYTFLSFAWAGNCAGLEIYPLWIADPSAASGHPRVPAPWKTWALHQYGSPGGIDLDIFEGDHAAWLALGGGSPAPAPTPAPKPVPVPTPVPTPQPKGTDVPYGLLNDGANVVTVVGFKDGQYKAVGFLSNNGLQKLPAASLSVSFHTAKGGWTAAATEVVDSTKGKTVVTFPAGVSTDGFSVERTDGGAVVVAWDVS